MVNALRSGVRRALAEFGVRAADLVVCACSGGPDSLALADALLALRPGKVVLLAVDHGLRPESAAEARIVADFARERGAPAEVVCVEVVRNGTGLEDAARRARYAALEAAADRLGAAWIAVGHTASDQAETVLGRLLRGAGPVGLAGIPPRRGRIIRPLLGLTRDVVRQYVAARGLAPAHDPMNEDAAFLRARLRHTHLPRLRAENPSLDATLARTAAALRETAEALDWMAAQIPARRAGGAIRIAVAALAAVPPAIAKRSLARQAETLGASLEARHLDALLALVARPTAGTRAVALPGLAARREYDDLILGERQRPAEVVAPPGHAVRTWRPGDRMRPARLRGRSRKLQDLFTDQKVPRELRRAARVWVRESDGAIVYAEHIGPSFDIEAEVALTIPDSPVIYD